MAAASLPEHSSSIRASSLLVQASSSPSLLKHLHLPDRKSGCADKKSPRSEHRRPRLWHSVTPVTQRQVNHRQINPCFLFLCSLFFFSGRFSQALRTTTGQRPSLEHRTRKLLLELIHFYFCVKKQNSQDSDLRFIVITSLNHHRY